MLGVSDSISNYSELAKVSTLVGSFSVFAAKWESVSSSYVVMVT